MLPVKHLAPKILIAVNYCGRQLAQRLEWAAPDYHKIEGAAPHMLERASLACCMLGGLMGDLGCGLGRGI